MKNLNYFILIVILLLLTFWFKADAQARPIEILDDNFDWYAFATHQIDMPFEVGQQAQVIFVKGNVQIKRGERGPILAPKKDMVLNVSDQIFVRGEQSFIEIKQRGGIIIKIKPGLDIETRRLEGYSRSYAFWLEK